MVKLKVCVELLKLPLISPRFLIFCTAAGVKLFQTAPVHSQEKPEVVSVNTLPIPGLSGKFYATALYTTSFTYLWY